MNPQNQTSSIPWMARAEIMSIADAMIQARWSPPHDIRVWDNRDWQTFVKGRWYVGMAYLWWGHDTVAQFLQKVSITLGGDVDYGNDCSSFAGYAWRLPQRETTASLAADSVGLHRYCRALGGPGSCRAAGLKPGDACNLSGVHILLVAEVRKDGIMSAEQARGPRLAETEMRRFWSYDYLDEQYKYTPIRRMNLVDENPEGSEPVITPPLVVTPPPVITPPPVVTPPPVIEDPDTPKERQTMINRIKRLWRKFRAWWKGDKVDEKTYPWNGLAVADGGKPGASHIRDGAALLAYRETHRLGSVSIDRARIHMGTERPEWPMIFGNARATVALIYRRGDNWFVQGFAGWCPDGRFSSGSAWFASDEIRNHGDAYGSDEIWVCLASGTRGNLSGTHERSNFVRA